jgi:hypothetical protein
MQKIAETGHERGDFRYIDTEKPDHSEEMKNALMESFATNANPLTFRIKNLDLNYDLKLTPEVSFLTVD